MGAEGLSNRTSGRRNAFKIDKKTIEKEESPMKYRSTAQLTAEALHDIARKITRYSDVGIDMTRLAERIEDINTTFAKSIGYANQLAASREKRAKDHREGLAEFKADGDRKRIRKIIEMLEEEDDIIIE